MTIRFLAVSDERCAGCMDCASACSKLYFREDNPAKSRIQIDQASRDRFHLRVCDQTCEACLRECPTQAIFRSTSGALKIDDHKCIGCLACVAVCPIGAMRWYAGMPGVFKCVACGACARACPKGALEIRTRKGEKP
ncbi:MAG TPA: 4Fe-4S binding protein [Rectinemataceae bacterium]